MKKSTIWLLAVIMALTFIGLLYVQIMYIKHVHRRYYPLPFAKIQDADTTLIERMHLKYLGGIYLDVFPCL